MTKIGALEAGGTKMVLAVYDGDGQELERLTIPTEAPEITMPRMTGFFRDHAIDALGVGSFGPLDLNPASPTYGNITSTPKLKWRNYPLLKGLLDGRDIPAAIDTDVNAAVIAEVECGAARGCESAVYITVGTGVGGGVLLGLPGAKKALYLPEAGIDLIGVGVAKGSIEVELPVLPVFQCLPGQSIRLLPVFLLSQDLGLLQQASDGPGEVLEIERVAHGGGEDQYQQGQGEPKPPHLTPPPGPRSRCRQPRPQ